MSQEGTIIWSTIHWFSGSRALRTIERCPSEPFGLARYLIIFNAFIRTNHSLPPGPAVIGRTRCPASSSSRDHRAPIYERSRTLGQSQSIGIRLVSIFQLLRRASHAIHRWIALQRFQGQVYPSTHGIGAIRIGILGPRLSVTSVSRGSDTSNSCRQKGQGASYNRESIYASWVG